MLFQATALVLIALGATANAAAVPLLSPATKAATLPQFDNTTSRAAAIRVKREGYLYGPSLLGNSSFFPTGSLAAVRIQADVAQFEVDSTLVTANSDKDLAAVQETITAVSHASLEDDCC